MVEETAESNVAVEANAGETDTGEGGTTSSAAARPKRSRPCRWLVWVFWLLTVLLVLATGWLIVRLASAEPPAPGEMEKTVSDVEIVRLETQEYVETLHLPARLAADRSVVVSGELQARLVEWLVQEGERVERGQKLLRLDVSDLDARREELLAAQHAATIRRDFARREYKRTKRLAADEIASEADLDGAETARDEAEAEVARIGRQLDSLSITIAKGVVRAPFAGYVDEHLVHVGTVLSPGQELTRVYDLRHCRVQVDVPDRYLPFLQADNPAIQDYITHAMPGGEPLREAAFFVPGLPKLTGGKHRGLRIPAKIARLAQATDPASNTFRVELRFENPGEALRGGMLGRAEIRFLRYPEAIVVPLRSLRMTDEGTRAAVAVSDGERDRVRVREITPISIQGDQVLVRGGLQAGDRLVVSGQQGLVDGEQVRVLKADGEFLPGAGSAEGESLNVPEDYRPAGDDGDGIE